MDATNPQNQTPAQSPDVETGIPLVATEIERVSVATPRQLMWWKFRKHKVAVASLVILILMYLSAFFADFLSPVDPLVYNGKYKFVPPQIPTFIDENGKFHLRPGVNGLISHRNEETLRITYSEDKSTWYPIKFFVKGYRYKLLGFETDRHLFGLDTDAPGAVFYPLGSDRLGRDMFARIIHGGRISLSIGLVSVFLSLILGVVLGGVSGYYGGWVDNLIQRVIEFIRSVPDLPLWMALSAALPPEWSQERRYFGITIILSIIGWTGLGRQVRGRFLALRTEDFVLAARLSGARDRRIILRHMVPSFTSHIIASLTLSIPGIILAETGLSFLGLGLRQPVISWGVLLQEAQNIRTVALASWLLLPGLAVVITVLAFNFLGDGLRDAADPFNR